MKLISMEKFSSENRFNTTDFFVSKEETWWLKANKRKEDELRVIRHIIIGASCFELAKALGKTFFLRKKKKGFE